MKNKIPFGLILVLTLFWNFSAQAQREKIKNLERFDERKIHFGFTLGINNSNFVLEHDLTQTDSLVSLESQQQPGFNLGIITDLHIGKDFNLRFVPDLSFGNRNLEYTFLNSDGTRSILVKTVESTWLDFPILLKYRSWRLNNFACYLLAGGAYSLDLASQFKVDNQFNNPNEIVIKLDRNSYSYIVGFGMDFFLEYFKFSPELRLSMSLNDILIDDDTDLSRPISLLKSKVWLISFNFEG